MDPDKKRALDLIESSVGKLSVAERGNQLLAVAADYVVDGDLVEARRVLGLVDDAYYDCPAPAEQTYREAIVRVVQAFGANLRVFCKGRGGSS